MTNFGESFVATMWIVLDSTSKKTISNQVRHTFSGVHIYRYFYTIDDHKPLPNIRYIGADIFLGNSHYNNNIYSWPTNLHNIVDQSMWASEDCRPWGAHCQMRHSLHEIACVCANGTVRVWYRWLVTVNRTATKPIAVHTSPLANSSGHKTPALQLHILRRCTIQTQHRSTRAVEWKCGWATLARSVAVENSTSPHIRHIRFYCAAFWFRPRLNCWIFPINTWVPCESGKCKRVKVAGISFWLGRSDQIRRWMATGTFLVAWCLLCLASLPHDRWELVLIGLAHANEEHFINQKIMSF